MKNYILLVFFLTIGTFFISSCNLNDVDSSFENIIQKNGVPIPSLIDYYNQISEPKNGAFGLEAHSNYSTQSIEKGGFDGLYYDENGEKQSLGVVEVGQVQVSPLTNNIYYVSNDIDLVPYFGEDTWFKIQNKKLKMYVPQHIKVLSPSLNNSATNLGPNQIITWNEDPLNSKGVVLVISYSPSETQNQPFSLQGYNSVVSRPILTADNGQYTFTASDFQGIPDGAKIRIILTRANFKNLQLDNQDNILVYSYSKNQGYCTYDAN